MTYQEIKTLAEAGDIRAMLSIGNHNYNKYQNDDLSKAIEESLPWYILAGRHGSLEGADLCMTCCSARILMAKEIGDWDNMSKYANEAAQLGAEFMQNEEFAVSKVGEETMKCMDICIYASSLSSYLMEEFEDAIESLDDFNPSSEYYYLAQILLGICLSDLDHDIDSAKFLFVLERNMNSILPELHDTIDEEIVERGTLYLALYYRLIEQKPTKAYTLITNALSIVEDAALRGILLDELRHYKKKLFGGYSYVD